MLRSGVVLALAATLAGGLAAPPRAAAGCTAPAATAHETRDVLRVLAAGRDVWGEQLLHRDGGPTYAAAARYLPPLFFARGPHGSKLTDSGVYYVPLADPPSPGGAGTVMLHVADGSEVLAGRVGGRTLTVGVGADGSERYGSCIGRLARARLAEGYLPVLETGYVDAAGVRYRQESFATHRGGALTSLLAVHADARTAAHGAVLRFTPSRVSVQVARGTTRDVYVAWRPGALELLDDATYAAARAALVTRWQDRLAQGMQLSVPEARVADAARALLVQNLLLGWRYSVGNPYEEFSFPEGPAVAGVMGEWGYPGVERAILETSLTRRSTGYASWKRGERLLASAAYYRRFRDRAYVDAATPALARFVDALAGSLRRSPPRLLEAERYSSDIPDAVYGLHAQTVAWAGLRAIAGVWAETGYGALAKRAAGLAAKLEPAVRAAVHASERRLRDGSLFVPARLLDHEPPYASLVQARLGSYWNLVTPFALSSGFFAPRSAEARGILRYLQQHGSRLLGLVRAGAYALYGRDAAFPVSGTDQVYGNDVSRFLADNRQADELVLSLYGQLAAGMTPETFVAGEAASVAPLDGRRDRSMYLPPNSAANASFLETLRLALVHETADGLELAAATPRAWLRPGARLAVDRATTGFGPLSYSIAVAAGTAHVRIDAPARTPPKRLTIRLRLPNGARIAGVRPATPFDAATGTIDVSGRRGSIELDISLTR